MDEHPFGLAVRGDVGHEVETRLLLADAAVFSIERVHAVEQLVGRRRTGRRRRRRTRLGAGTALERGSLHRRLADLLVYLLELRTLPREGTALDGLPREDRRLHVPRQRLRVAGGLESLRLAPRDDHDFLSALLLDADVVGDLAFLGHDADLVLEGDEGGVVAADGDDLQHLAILGARPDAALDQDVRLAVAGEVVELETCDRGCAADHEILEVELLAAAEVPADDGEKAPVELHELEHRAARDVPDHAARGPVREVLRADQAGPQALLRLDRQRRHRAAARAGRAHDPLHPPRRVRVRVAQGALHPHADLVRLRKGRPRDRHLEGVPAVGGRLHDLGAADLLAAHLDGARALAGLPREELRLVGRVAAAAGDGEQQRRMVFAGAHRGGANELRIRDVEGHVHVLRVVAHRPFHRGRRPLDLGRELLQARPLAQQAVDADLLTLHRNGIDPRGARAGGNEHERERGGPGDVSTREPAHRFIRSCSSSASSSASAAASSSRSASS